MICPFKSTPAGQSLPAGHDVHNGCTKTACQLQIRRLFEKYCERDRNGNNVIGPDGIVKFCKDLGVGPENIRMLVIAFLMDARKAGYFTKDEWILGLTKLQCDSIAAIKQNFGKLEKIFQNHFHDIFDYAYNYLLIGNNEEYLNMKTARRLLSLLIWEWDLYPEFDLFLKQCKYKVINPDQWKMILQFVIEMRDREKISTAYNPNDSWPLIFDEFVEWMKNSAAVGEPTTTNSDE